MADKKFGYDIKVNYNNIQDDTQKVIRGIQELDKAIGRLKNVKDISINVKAGGDQFKKLTEYAAQLDKNLKTASVSGANLSQSLGQVTSQFKNVRDMTRGVSKEVTDASRNIEKLGQSLQRSVSNAKEQSLSGQIANLKKQAEANYRQNFDSNPMVYARQARALNAELQKLYQAQHIVNQATKENIGTLKQWGIDTENVGHRLGYLATRMVASFALDKVTHSFAQVMDVEKDMAGFAQVMKHGTGATNAFAKSLLEVDPSNMKNSLQLGGAEAEHFKTELIDMQNQLQGLAIKYGTTSNEMIESAKLWGRAYKDNNTVLALTDAATKLAVADAFDIVSANKALESSIMQWGFEINNTNDAMSVSNRIIDSWTALAHNYTVSAQTLSEANKRMAQSAAEVGVGFHTAQALVAVMARKTQADGGEIGNALKSIFGSIHSKKGIQELQNFGVEVYKIGEDGTKSFRKVDDVLLDLMINAEGSKKSMEGLLKAISGGKWQWNKADAMLDLKEYLEALRLSSTSMGFTDAQVGMQLDTIATKLKQIAAQWEKIMTGNGNTATILKTMLDGILGLLKWIDSLPPAIFAVTTALIGLIAVHRAFGQQFLKLKTNIVKGWHEASASVRQYAVAQRQAYAQANGFGGKVSAVGKSFTGLGGAINSVTAFMGGWIGIAITAITVLTELGFASRFSSEEIEKQVDSHSKLLQTAQETYARLDESKNILSQLTTAYYELKQKQKEYANTSQDTTRVSQELTIAEEGIIEILGEEQAGWVLSADNAEEANSRIQNAVETRKQELEKQIAREKELLVEAADAVRQQAKDNLESLNEEKKGWLDRMMVIVQFTKLLDLCRLAYYSLMEAFSKWRAKQAADRLNNQEGVLHEAEETLAKMKSEGASDEQIAQAERNVQMAKYSLSHIKDQHERLEKDAADYGKQGDAILAETKANIINEKNDKLDKINSSLYGNGHGNSSTIGGGTTGNYNRDELDDGSGDANGKKSKSKKENNPLHNTPAGEAIDFLMKQGYTANQAYGIVGNLQIESFDRLDPEATDGHAWGIAQWQDDRLENLKNFASANNSDWKNRDTQLAFLVHEMQTTEKGAWLKVLQNSPNQTPEEIAHAFDIYYERSAGIHNWERQVKARNLANSNYGEEIEGTDNRAKKILDRQNKIDELQKKLGNEMAEMENAMKPKEQADLTKETQSLKEKLQGIQKEIDELIKLNPKADVKKLQETMKKYEQTISHRLQDKYRDKDYDEATQMMKDRHESEDIQREINGSSENFWTSDLRNANRLVEEYTIKFKKYQDMVAAFKRGDSEYTEADIRKAHIELQKLEAQIKKTGNALNQNIKQQTHDVFHGLIFEGKKFKDVWKDLWKQLAEDALKMIFKMQDGNGGLWQNLLKKFDKRYQKGINPVLGGDGKNIGGIDNADNQLLMAQSTHNLDKNFETFLANTEGGTAWKQATFTDAVIYGNIQGDKSDADIPDNTTDKDGKQDVSQYINAGMKLAGGNNKWVGTLGTIAGLAKQFGLLKFAGGGSVDKDQLVRVGEGDKKEWIIPTEDKARGRQLLSQAAKDLGMGVTNGIEPKWQHEDTKNGALSEQTKRQEHLMNQMVANTQAMTKGMNYMANGGSGTKESIAQPVFVKQTISDQDFLAKYQKLIALGKLKQS